MVHPPTLTAPPGAAVADLADALKRAWRDGSPADAAAALRDHPELLAHRSLVVDLAYEEYCLREDAGEAPSAEELCARLPAFRSQVREVLRGHQLLVANPELLRGAASRWPEPGDECAGLTVVRELGRGAFARVFLAEDPQTGGRRVALKLSAAPSAEARTIGTVRHPHVAEVYWAEWVDGLYAVCMPFVGAATLQDAIGAAFRRGGGPRSAATLLDVVELSARLTPPTAAEAVPPLVPTGTSYPAAVAAVAARLAGALAHLHRRGIAHGDLKPSNVILGPGGYPYLIDFNLATTDEDARLRCGGTLPYMAPERLRVVTGGAWDPAAAPASDVYSFGVVLYEALTGRLPHEPVDRPDPAEVAADLLRRQALGPPALDPDVPATFARLVRRCLAFDPAARPTAADLPDVLGRLSQPRAHGRTGAVVAAAAMVLGCGVFLGANRTRPADAPANPEPAAQAPTAPDPRPVVPAAEVVPATAKEFFDRGVRRLAEGKGYDARLDFIEAQRKRDDGPTQAYLGYCFALDRSTADALHRFDAAIDRYGFAPPWVRCNRAYCLTRSNPKPEDYLRAVDDATLALDADPTLRPARYTRAYAQYYVNVDKVKAGLPVDWAGCRADIREVVKSGPCDAELYYRAALIFVAGADGDETLLAQAVEYLREATANGHPPAALRGDPSFKPLFGRPAFNQILAAPPASAPKPAADPNLRLAVPPTK